MPSTVMNGEVLGIEMKVEDEMKLGYEETAATEVLTLSPPLTLHQALQHPSRSPLSLPTPETSWKSKLPK